MVHLTNTLRSATFLLGTAMLMLFLFCAPMHAQTPTFKSTSSYRIANPNYSAQQLDPTTIGHQAYRSTIYTPFGSSTPSANNNPGGNNNSGSGTDDDDDIGIPGYADTPGEPLPIGDGTLFLLLIAAMMITIIAIKQRKQKQLQSITTINNNNPTQHMTTRKQTYQSFFQKLFLLLVFCGFATNTFAWKPIMIGHKGCRKGVENTEQAFINGVTQYGFQGLECDVKMTKDGHYVCWHDDVITTSFGLNANCTIATTTLADLQAKTLTQTRNTVQYTGKICTVDRYLEICKQYNVIPVIELKKNATICNTDMTGFPGLYALIEKHGLVDKAIILTSMDGSLTYIKEHYPHLKRQYLTNGILSAEGTDELIEFCIENGCDMSACDYYGSSRNVKEADVIKAHNAGIKVAFWTMNSLADYNKYGAYGPSFITSDDLVPAELPELTGTDPNATKMIYFRLGTTNFSSGYDVDAKSNYTQVFWIKNGYIAMAIHNPSTSDTVYIEQGRTKEEIYDGDVSNRFLSMVLPEGYTQVAAYRLSDIATHGEGTYGYASWNHSSNISNRIPVKNKEPHFIDIPDDKNLLVHYEGYWNKWYWAYYLPKNNDVCIYFANNNNWNKVKMLTGKDIYTYPTEEFEKIDNTNLYYCSLIGEEYGYTQYGFINSSNDALSKGWDAGLIPPINCYYNQSNSTPAFDGNRNTNEAAVKANETNKANYGINVTNLSDNLIADRIKDAPNYTGLRDDLLKGINLFTPSSTNGSAVDKTPINSWQDLNHTHTVTVEEGGKLNYGTTWLTGASSSFSKTWADKTGTITFQAAYTASVTLRAIPDDGYVFLGFYDAEKNEMLSRGVQEPYNSYPISHRYTYDAPNSAQKIIAKFVKGNSTRYFKVRTMIYNGSLIESLDGGTFTMTHSGGITYTHAKIGYHEMYVSDAPMTFEATPKSGYEFIGWFNVEPEKRYPDNRWIIDNPMDTEKYENGITAVFASSNYAKKQNINIEGSGTVEASYIFYHDGTSKTITFEQNSSFVAWTGKQVTLTATPLAGYKFDGWYKGEAKIWPDAPYYYNADDANTITAKFVSEVNKLTVSVLNYNTSYNEFREYEYEYNTITLTGGGKTLESYSSFSCEFEDATNVTLTATPEPEEETGYDFIGWYQNNTLLSDQLTINVNVIGLQAISARFAPKKCWKLTLKGSVGGLYSVKYARETEFLNQEGMYYIAHSQYNRDVEIYVPYQAKIAIVNPQPIHGYEYIIDDNRKGCRIFNETNNHPCDIINNDPRVYQILEGNSNLYANLARTEEQVVYLDISNKDKSHWKDVNNEEFYCSPRSFFTTQQNTIKFEKVDGNIYKVTIPELFEGITIIKNGDATNHTTLPLAIPSTRYNCFKLNAYPSSTGEWVDTWTTLPTQTGDYRLIYREQTVVNKNEICIDYEFNEGDRIKNINFDNQTAKTKTDIVSLHIYNKVYKVSDDETINGVNNPEVILQQWNGTEWADVERYMVFGPLRSNNTGVIKMPHRKNTTGEKIAVDQGIGNIIAAANNDDDQACGVWNFVIQQTKDNASNVTAKLLVNETHRYEGDYYIRTTNADGQYYNYTQPGNVMKFSEYAAANSDYSHYFIRYVDINEDGTPTAQAGKHNQVKFTVATAYTEFLCKELMINNNRFSEDEYENDIFVINDNNNPKLPADATVRFGWDRVTNRLTRAYIANTTIKNNEYLVVEGTNIGSTAGDAAYFTDNSNWLYSIDLPSATTGATAKVKAKMNGQYQYFMGAQPGSQNEYQTLISGNGANTYPIRLLYDFKDDRFTTIYRPKSGTINNDVTLSTPLMIEREHNEPATQIQLETNKKITTVQAGEDQYTQPAYAVMTFLEEILASKDITHHEKMFYWISFPFDVRIKDVFGLGDYGKYWIMEEYNGAQRAKSGLAQNNWKYITKKSHILKKDTGYVICLNYSQILQDQLFKSYGGSDETLNNGKLSLYFPSNSVISPAAITGGQRRTVELARYDNTTTGSNTAWNHHNWHIIGVPSFANPEFVDIQDDIPFVYQYWHPGDAYSAESINEVEFQAMHAYMVQYHGTINWESIVNTGDGNIQPKALAAKTDEQADKKVMLRLELQQAGSTLDKTYVQLRNDKGTKGFDMSLDLTKIINAGANIYSIVDNHEMAGNAIPKEETVLPLGVVITAAGEYTFAMPNGTEGMIIELIDYEQGTSTNLLVGDYTVNMPEGTNNTRFALRLKPDKVATSVEDITSGTNDNNVRKLLIDGVLYLVKDGAVYDAQGHCVR